MKIKNKVREYLGQLNYRPRSILLAIALASLILTVYIFWSYFYDDRGWIISRFLTFNNNIFIISFIIIFFINIFVSSLIGNIYISQGVLFGTIELLLTIDRVKRLHRDIPLIPEDIALLSEAGDQGEVIEGGLILVTLAKLVILILLILGIKYLTKKRRTHPDVIRKHVFSRLSLALISFLILSSFANYLARPEFIHGPDLIVRSKMVLWSQLVNYKNNGPIIGMLYNFGLPKVSKPDNYSKKTIMEIVDKYKELNSLKKETGAKVPSDINIIYIMSESFTDPKDFTDVYPVSGDTLEYTTKLISESTGGRVAVSEFGGGTSNVEFEALTGFSNTFTSGNMPYNNYLAKDNQVPSIVSLLKPLGYEAIAFHPYKREMYKRFIVYKNLGFDTFIDQTMMTDPEFVGLDCTGGIDGRCFVSDESNYKEIISLIETTSKPVFIHNVTMQNHTSYTDKYITAVQNPSASDKTTNDRLNYLYGLEVSDVALEKFIEQIDSLNEKTIIVFWGDHLPGSSIYDNVLALNQDRAYQTPFFIYSNFPTSKQNYLISTNFLQEVLFKELQSPTSPFLTLLNELRQKMPVVTKKKIEQIEGITPEVLIDYELIQYDVLHGKKYSLAEEFFKLK